MNKSASSSGSTIPRPDHRPGDRPVARVHLRMNRPVTQNTRQAAAKMSMNQRQAAPVLRPLCRSLKYETQPRSVARTRPRRSAQVDAQPGVAARTRQREVDLLGRPLGLALADLAPTSARASQRRRSSRQRGRLLAGRDRCGRAARRSASGRRSVMRRHLGLAPRSATAWFSVMPVMLNSSMPSRHTAALIQCHWCSVFSHQAAALAVGASVHRGRRSSSASLGQDQLPERGLLQAVQRAAVARSAPRSRRRTACSLAMQRGRGAAPSRRRHPTRPTAVGRGGSLGRRLTCDRSSRSRGRLGLADEADLGQAGLGRIGQRLRDEAVGDGLVGAQVHLGLRLLACLRRRSARAASARVTASPFQNSAPARVDRELDLLGPAGR